MCATLCAQVFFTGERIAGAGNGEHLACAQLRATRDAIGRAQGLERNLVALGDRFQALSGVHGVRARAVIAVTVAIAVVIAVVFVLARGSWFRESVARVLRWVERARAAAVRVIQTRNGELLPWL